MTEIAEDMATLNITFNRQSGDMPDPVSFELDNESVKMMAAEAISGGSVVGISQVEATAVDFEHYMVDRFEAHDGLDSRIYLRPKTPVGLG